MIFHLKFSVQHLQRLPSRRVSITFVFFFCHLSALLQDFISMFQKNRHLLQMWLIWQTSRFPNCTQVKLNSDFKQAKKVLWIRAKWMLYDIQQRTLWLLCLCSCVVWESGPDESTFTHNCAIEAWLLLCDIKDKVLHVGPYCGAFIQIS